MTSFTDDFNRPDSTDLGSGWVEVTGDWSIVSGQLSPGSTGGTIILRAATAMASSDHYAQVTIAATTAASHGVWCRGNANISQGYLWRNDGATWNLFSVVSSTFTVIGTYVAAAAPGDVAKIQAVGSTIKGFVNGVERVSVTDTAVAAGTSVGIRGESTSAIRYDDFAAADITAGTTLGSSSAVETAQPLTGAKATAPAGAAAIEAAQALTGMKAALLPSAVQTEAAQPLTATASGSLAPAGSVDASRALAGIKSAAFSPALETSVARSLVTAGADDDVDVTVGAPYSAPYSTGAPHSSGWKVGVPR
ncbi:hypothetical protein ABZT16_11565 [Streptomyces flaveolus]|uniref:hypothetical protein n=1 Tax=Streptomyces flaveolus TaxID=67297 RepID=UPI0033A3DB55